MFSVRQKREISDAVQTESKPLPEPQCSAAGQRIYAYIKAPSGQILCGYFDQIKLPKLVEFFVECEQSELPNDHEQLDA
jgi:hypothetical protein